MNLSEQFASWINEFGYEQMPETAIKDVKRAFLDTVGVAAAGADEDVSVKVLEYAEMDRAGGSSTVIAKGRKFSPATAGFINAVMAHVLDYDDVNPPTKCHASSVLAPAVLAAGEDAGSSGKDLIAAYAVGLEIMAKIGVLLGPEHYEWGWHTTTTLGAFGAAAAAAKLYGLPVPQIINALGIIASQIGGLRRNFGTMTKSLHSGFAVENGIMAALLARQGVTAGRDVFEGDIGFIRLYGNRPETGSLPAVDFSGPLEICESGLSIKRYPSCYGTHRSADAVLDHILVEHAIDPSAIESISCISPQGAFMAVIHDRPSTGLEGKFSVQYVIAAALVDKKLDINSFTDEMVQRPQIQELIRKVRKIEEPIGPPGSHLSDEQKYCIIRLQMSDGSIAEARVDTPKGARSDPLSDKQLEEKFRSCTRKSHSTAQTENIISIINDLENLQNTAELSKWF